MTRSQTIRLASVVIFGTVLSGCGKTPSECEGVGCDLGSANSPVVNFFVANTGSRSHSVSVIDDSTRSVISTIKVGGQPHGSAPAAAGDRVYVTLEDRPEVVAIDTRSLEILWRAQIGRNLDPKMLDTRLNEPSLALGDRFLYAPDVTGHRQVIIDTNRGEMVGQIAMIDPEDGTRMIAPHNTYASSDGRWIFATAIFSRKIAKIDAETRQIVRVYPLAGQPRPAALLDDSSKIYVQYSQLHGFVELDLSTGRETARIVWPESRESPDSFTKCHGIGVSPNQQQLWAASNIDGAVYVYSLPNLELVGSIVVGDMPNWVAFTPDSRFVYVTTQEDEISNGNVTVIDTTSLSIVSTIEVGHKPKRIHMVVVRP